MRNGVGIEKMRKNGREKEILERKIELLGKMKVRKEWGKEGCRRWRKNGRGRAGECKGKEAEGRIEVRKAARKKG